MRRAQQRRGGVAAIVDVGLERVVLDIVDEDATGHPFQIIGDAGGVARLNLFVACGLGGKGQRILAHIGQRGGGGYDDIGRLHLRGIDLRARRNGEQDTRTQQQAAT